MCRKESFASVIFVRYNQLFVITEFVITEQKLCYNEQLETDQIGLLRQMFVRTWLICEINGYFGLKIVL